MKDIGLVQLTDSSSILHHKIGTNWAATDTFSYPIYRVIPTDLNGDRYKDLLVTYYVTGSGGNFENIVFIYNPVSNQFKHNQHFDLPNIGYDKSKKKVRSSWWRGVGHPQNKMTYKITGDSLTFDQEVTYTPDDEPQGYLGKVEFYVMKDGKQVVIKKITGRSEKIWSIFTKALWDTSNE